MDDVTINPGEETPKKTVTIDKNVLNTLIGDELSAVLSQAIKEGIVGEKTTRATVESDLSDPGHAERVQARVAEGADVWATINAFAAHNNQVFTHSINMSHAGLVKSFDAIMADHARTGYDKLVNIDETSAWLNRILRTENVADALQVAMANLVNAIWERLLEVKEEK